MRRHLIAVALLLIDVSAYESIMWLREAVRVSSEIDLPLAAEIAFAVGGCLLLVGIPFVGWTLIVQVDEAHVLPRARVIRAQPRAT